MNDYYNNINNVNNVISVDRSKFVRLLDTIDFRDQHYYNRIDSPYALNTNTTRDKILNILDVCTVKDQCKGIMTSGSTYWN